MRICRGNALFLATVICLAALGLLSGCGASGDLYLPPDSSHSSSS